LLELIPNYDKYLVKLKEDLSQIPAIDNKYKFLVGGRRITQDYLTQSGRVVAKVKEILNEVRKERKIAYEKLNEKLLSLTDSLGLYATKIANLKRSKAISKADIANNKLNTIKWIIVIYCILAGSFLLVLIYMMFKYLQRYAISKKILTRSKLRAENLAQTKEMFLANMSHEIRTPLNAIVGFTNQLLKSEQTAEQREQTQIIQSSSTHLLQIVNEILDYSKLESGNIILESIAFSPSTLVHEVAHILMHTAAKQQTRIVCDVLENTPQYVMGDPVRIRQILLNLASNAIKFTENGTVTLTLSAKIKSEKDILLFIKVKDNGIGISKEKIQLIFNKFSQADAGTTRKYGGTGLGLSICKRIIDVHGGSIQVESEINKGSAFSVTLPLKLANDQNIALGNGYTPSIANLRGKRILIVDDQEFNRKLLRVVLTNWGAVCRLLEDGIQVLEELENNTFDMILMDIRMPELDGIKTTKKIRSYLNKEIANIPIIGISAAITEEDKADGTAAGMNGFISKPFTEEKLANVLHTFLSNTTPDFESEDILHYSELEAIANGDNAVVINLLEVYLETTENGIKQMIAVAEQNDLLQLREIAHKIASPNRYIGAENFYLKIKRIETEMQHTAVSTLKSQLQMIQKTFYRIQQDVLAKINELKTKSKG
jgi:CheY-like chemotaxis protein